MADKIRIAVLIEAKDNVLTVLEPVAAGDVVSDGKDTVTATEDIPVYHKIARQALRRGDALYKYGQLMGYATMDIEKGAWVHTHNADSEQPEGSDV